MKFKTFGTILLFILLYSCVSKTDKQNETPKKYRILMFWSDKESFFNERIDSLMAIYAINGFIIENNVSIEKAKGFGLEFNDPAPKRVISGYWNNPKAEEALMNVPEYQKRFDELNKVLNEFVYFFGDDTSTKSIDKSSFESIGFNLSYCDDSKLDQYTKYLNSVKARQDSLGYRVIKTLKVTYSNKTRPTYINIVGINKNTGKEYFEKTLNKVEYIKDFIGTINYDIWFY